MTTRVAELREQEEPERQDVAGADVGRASGGQSISGMPRAASRSGVAGAPIMRSFIEPPGTQADPQPFWGKPRGSPHALGWHPLDRYRPDPVALSRGSYDGARHEDVVAADQGPVLVLGNLSEVDLNASGRTAGRWHDTEDHCQARHVLHASGEDLGLLRLGCGGAAREEEERENDEADPHWFTDTFQGSRRTPRP